VNVYLDGKYSLSLARILAARLAIGQEVDDALLAQLKAQDEAEKAYERALKFLGPRPRSEAEVLRRLKEHGVEPALIEAVAARLKQAGLINDAAFASYWVENRVTFRPRSRRLIRAELKQKGVDEETARAALEAADDDNAAYTLATQRARRLKDLPYEEFRRKLGDFLARRGFDYDVIGEVAERVWREMGEGQI
jgi:regulatory protein